jgi:hypothetical protein
VFEEVRAVSMTRNPQANAIIERVHQMIGNAIRTFDIQAVNGCDLWTGSMLNVCSASHTSHCVSSLNKPTSV